jgi:hypothetical protein
MQWRALIQLNPFSLGFSAVPKTGRENPAGVRALSE